MKNKIFSFLIVSASIGLLVTAIKTYKWFIWMHHNNFYITKIFGCITTTIPMQGIPMNLRPIVYILVVLLLDVKRIWQDSSLPIQYMKFASL